MQPDPAPLPFDAEDAAPSGPPPRGSQARGLVLHKLLEEVLTGETAEDEAALMTCAAVLAGQLSGVPGAGSLEPAKAARAVRCGLAVPAVATVRNRLVPEYSVARSVLEDAEEVVTWGWPTPSRGAAPGPSWWWTGKAT